MVHRHHDAGDGRDRGDRGYLAEGLRPAMLASSPLLLLPGGKATEWMERGGEALDLKGAGRSGSGPAVPSGEVGEQAWSWDGGGEEENRPGPEVARGRVGGAGLALKQCRG